MGRLTPQASELQASDAEDRKEVHTQPTGPLTEAIAIRVLFARGRWRWEAALPLYFDSFSRFFFTSSALRATRFQTAARPMALVAMERVFRASSRMRRVPS